MFLVLVLLFFFNSSGSGNSKISGGVVQIGSIKADSIDLSNISNNSFSFADSSKINELEEFFNKLRKEQDSIGAKILIRVEGLMPGIGSRVFSKLDAELAKSMMGVNAVKAVELGAGVSVVEMKGSENRDLIKKDGFETNNSGGILGWISNGDDIDIFVSLKPTSSISQKQVGPIKESDVEGQIIVSVSKSSLKFHLWFFFNFFKTKK